MALRKAEKAHIDGESRIKNPVMDSLGIDLGLDTGVGILPDDWGGGRHEVFPLSVTRRLLRHDSEAQMHPGKQSLL
jgi:hypothetical protein